MKSSEMAEKISESFSSIHFYCQPKFEMELSHQAIRVMQFIAIRGSATVQMLSRHLGTAHNTASEIVRRLRDKGLVVKERCQEDERVVEVLLTDEGRRSCLQQTGLDIPRLTEALESVSVEERKDIQRAFMILLQAVGGD